MQKTIAKIDQLLKLGNQITTSNPETRQLQFEIGKLDYDVVKSVATHYGSPILEPVCVRPDYRTTILNGNTKINVLSKRLQLAYKFTH